MVTTVTLNVHSQSFKTVCYEHHILWVSSEQWNGELGRIPSVLS